MESAKRQTRRSKRSRSQGSYTNSAPLARSLCVVSGKGGTGKSMLSASLATLLAQRGETLLFDADLGVGNAHILQGVSPKYTVADVLNGNVPISEALQPCRGDLNLLAGGSGLAQLANLHSSEIDLLAASLSQVEQQHTYMLIDSAAGLSRQTMAFAAASDAVLLVATPAVTALTDAYAFLKVLWTRCPEVQVWLALNRVHSQEQGLQAAKRLSQVSQRFLGRPVECVATLPEHTTAFQATQERRPVIDGDRDNELARGIIDLERELQGRLLALEPRGFGDQLTRHIFV